jgi:hypothetical protein
MHYWLDVEDVELTQLWVVKRKPKVERISRTEQFGLYMRTGSSNSPATYTTKGKAEAKHKQMFNKHYGLYEVIELQVREAKREVLCPTADIKLKGIV